MRQPFCSMTYTDALTWDEGRTDRELRALMNFLRNVPSAAPELVRELRAIRYARYDAHGQRISI